MALTEQQYDILIKIGKQIRFLGSGFHWQPGQQFPSWDVVIENFGHFFVLPMCFNWLGHLKLALIKEGVADAESIYLLIYNAVKSSKNYQTHYTLVDRCLRKVCAGSDPVICLHHQTHPLDFLVFKHLADGNFEICIRKNLNVPGLRKVSRIGKVSKNFNFKSNDEIGLASHLQVLNTLSSIAVSAPITQNNNSKLQKFNPSNANLLDKGRQLELFQRDSVCVCVNIFYY